MGFVKKHETLSLKLVFIQLLTLAQQEEPTSRLKLQNLHKLAKLLLFLPSCIFSPVTSPLSYPLSLQAFYVRLLLQLLPLPFTFLLKHFSFLTEIITS